MNFTLPLTLSAIVFIAFFCLALFVNSKFNGKYFRVVIGYVLISFLMNAYLFLEKNLYLDWYEGPLYQFIAVLASLTLLYKENTTYIYGSIITVLSSLLCLKIPESGDLYLFLGVGIGHIITFFIDFISGMNLVHHIQFEDFEKMYLQEDERE